MSTELLEAREIAAGDLINEVRAMKADGQRLITATCLDIDEDTVEIIYHFDKDLKMTHLRLTHKKSEPVPSISGEYFCAFLVENEMNDQYGVCFDGLVLDYGGTLYLEGEVSTTPFCRYGVTSKDQ